MDETTQPLDATLVKGTTPGPAASDDAFTPGTIVNDRYRIEDVLGRGGFGRVFRATDSILGRAVAFKVLFRNTPNHPLGTLIDEAKTVAKLDHPHIVPVYDVGVTAGIPWMAMKLIDGTALDKLLTRQRFTLDQTTRIVAQAADALQHAHRRGIVHRDIKPANILLTSNDSGADHVWLADFGIAKILGGETSDDLIAGTPSYMAPEQITGKRVDARTDIFALGCITSELITGRRCFPAGTYSELVYRIVHDPPNGVGEIGAIAGDAVEKVVHRALAKSPEDRFQTVEELSRELLRAAEGRPADASRMRKLFATQEIAWDGRDVLIARGVEKRYSRRKRVVRGVDLSVERGSIHALLGRNGSGKTTLLRTLLGFYRRDAGEVRIFGRDPQREPHAVLARVGYVSESLPVYDSLRVSDVLMIHRRSYPDWEDATAYEMLSRYELPLESRVRTLSRGARTQLALICALGHRPELLVLDDPTLGLDALVLEEFFDMLATTARRDGTTVLIASHNIAEVEAIATHVSLFDDGRIILEDSLTHLRTRTRQVTLTFRDDVPDAIRSIADFTTLRSSARRVTGVVLDESTGALDRLKALGPAEIEVRELSLKEIFVNFMRARG